MPTTSAATEGRQYLTFALGREEYGVDILKIQEIRGYAPVTPIPNTPPHITGVMNLRGAIIPIVDLRRTLAMPATEPNAFTVIVVVAVGTNQHGGPETGPPSPPHSGPGVNPGPSRVPKVMGLIVDSVSDVLTIAPKDVTPAPDFGGQVDARFIDGIARAGDKLVVLLDIERVLAGEEAAVA